MHIFPESPVEIADIVEADHTRDLPDLPVRFFKQSGARIDPAIIHIAHYGHFYHGFEEPAELAFAHAEFPGKLRKRDLPAAALLDVLEH